MTDRKKDKKENSNKHDVDMNRRNFVGGSLLGAGASMLGMTTSGLTSMANAASTPEPSKYRVLGPEWSGPGGIGDYANSNGNTYSVVNAAHSVRDGFWNEHPDDVIDAGEVDMAIVGGGFSGLMAAYTFNKEGKGNCVMFDNHPIFGGEAKQNEVEVDGYHLYAPQGSNGFLWPGSVAKKLHWQHPVWEEIGLPMNEEDLQWQRKASGTDKPLLFANDNYDGMHLFWREANVGYFYKDTASPDGHKWVKDPWANAFKDAPLPEKAKRELMMIRYYEHREDPGKNWAQWLDSMTYKEFLQNVVGVTQQEVFDYLDPMTASHGPALGTDVISAFAALYFGQPGVAAIPKAAGEPNPFEDDISLASFPGGNAGIARHMVKAMMPDAIEGDRTLGDVLYNKINWRVLDRPKNKVQMRLGAQVVRVEHDGKANSADKVIVTYLKGGKAYRVKAKGVVMASGQWVNKHVLRDEPKDLFEAMNNFYHAPMMTVNVALRNWRFMEKLGITCARWFDGFGWFANIRAPMIVDGKHMPLDPNKPAMLTFYMPFTEGVSHSGMPIQAQAIAARTQLFSLSGEDIRSKVRQQLTTMFGKYGFDAKRDIAEIIFNRWGHAYVAPQPGFYFGKNGQKTWSDRVREGYGRVRFGHSELVGEQMWFTACQEGERAAKEVLNFI